MPQRTAYAVMLGVCLSALVALSALAQTTPDQLPITEDVLYTVRGGDTLDTIGALFDVSPTCLKEQNDIERPARLQVGAELLISITCPRYNEDPRDMGKLSVLIEREVSTYEDDCTGYRVRLNDNPDLIAFAEDVALEALLEANELQRNQALQVGQCLVIPQDVPPWGVVPALSDATLGMGGGADIPEGAKTHVVQPRETLDGIAFSYNLETACLAEVNALARPGRLIVGMVLVIDETCPAYVPPNSAPLRIRPASEAQAETTPSAGG